VVFEGANDYSKHMIISLPSGDSTVQISAKSKTTNFYPKLYYQVVEDMETKMQRNELDFPPNGSPGFSTASAWDRGMKSLNEHIDVKSLFGTKGGLVLTLFDS